MSLGLSYSFIMLRFLYGFFGFATGIESTRVSDIEPVALAKGFYAIETCLHEKLPVKGAVFRRRFVKSHPEDNLKSLDRKIR